jgi:D-alanyl-D-alanine carboxypeptidase
MLKSGLVAGLAGAGVAVFVAAAVAAEPTQVEQIQAALDAWVKARAPSEKITGIAAYVSFGQAGPAIEAFAGTTGREPDQRPVDQDTLYQIGSITKSFAAAVILQLEAEGKLSIDDALGKFLPEYPAWKDVTIRRLLDMTSGIPTYSETETISNAWAKEPQRDFSLAELVKIAYPTGANDLPPTKGYFYSNTNYILAAMIAEKITGKSYRDLVHERIIGPFGLTSTFYESSTYPESVMKRLSHGYFADPECAAYQPAQCKQSWNLPILGKDMHDMSLSWAQSAGGAISNARDTDRWVRAIFGGKVVPAKQQAEWESMVSQKTGDPIPELTPDDPRGFALGLGRGIFGPLGTVWFYQGETLGYRTLYAWFADKDLAITVQTNSHPPEAENKLSDAIVAIHRIVGKN